MSLSTYYVVEFQTPPRPDVGRYSCVPDKWLWWTDEPNSKAAVAYPDGNPDEVEYMARMNEAAPYHWVVYRASVKYCTTSYEQAISYLRVLREIGSSITITNVTTNQRRFSEGPIRPRATYQRPLVINVSTEVPMRPTRASAGTANSWSVSGTQIHDDHLNRSSRGSSNSRPMPVSQHNTPTTSMRNVNVMQNVLHGCQHPGATSGHACCATKFDAVLENVQANVQKLVTEFGHWATVNDRNNEKLTEVDAWMKDYQIWKRSVEARLRERPSICEMPRRIKAEIILIEDDDDDDDDAANHGNSTLPNQGITRQEPRRVNQRRMAQFTLPPEYDRHDSRWTLRYRDPGPTSTELMPRSRIYADTIKLAFISASAVDCKSLARLLMMEVFSDNALKVCSFTGKRSYFYCRDSPVRPGLDENGRNTLVEYVEKYGRQKRWRIPDAKAIIQTMCGKLKDCRRKAQIRN